MPALPCIDAPRRCAPVAPVTNRDQYQHGRFIEREFSIDNPLVRIHFNIVMIKWTGLAPWDFESPFSGSLTSTFLEAALYTFPEERTLSLRERQSLLPTQPPCLHPHCASASTAEHTRHKHDREGHILALVQGKVFNTFWVVPSPLDNGPREKRFYEM